MVYVFMVDRLEAHITACLASEAEIDPDAEREAFDEWLNAEPEPVDTEKYELMRALGVAR